MNIRKLREVQLALLKQSVTPNVCRFNMKHFGVAIHDLDINSMTPDAKPDCGTQACIAGETLLIARLARIPKGGGFKLRKKASKLCEKLYPNATRSEAELLARKVLGLTDKQARRLFYFEYMGQGFGWPTNFQQAYQECTTATGRALIGAQRMELFIQTNGKQ